MKKKIDLFWYWFIFVVAFVLCFFAINNKKVNAYHLNENGNIVSDNLINISDISINSYGVVFETNNNNFSISGIKNSSSNSYASINVNDFNANGVYTLYRSSSWQGNVNLRTNDNVNLCSLSWGQQYKTCEINGVVSKIYFDVTGVSIGTDLNISGFFTLAIGDMPLTTYEPFGIWYGESFVGDLATGVISYSSASLTYDNRDYGTSHSIADVSSYIDSSFGFIYFDRLWAYLDTLTSSEYENAWLTLQLNNKMNLNTIYVLNAMFNNGNYGVGVKFYQGETLILNVTNWINNNYSYCNETDGATCSVQLSNFVNVGDKPDLQNSFTYFDKIEIWSGDTDKRTGSFGFQNISYNQGYNSGYNIGYSTGVSIGESTGYNQGYNSGYLYGYEKGVDAVEGTDNTLVGLVGGILTAPVNMLKTIFDFEFLGINLTHFIFSIVSLFIVIWLIKVFL